MNRVENVRSVIEVKFDQTINTAKGRGIEARKMKFLRSVKEYKR
jgi:hypothetical protein